MERKEVRNRTQDLLRAGPFHYHYVMYVNAMPVLGMTGN